MAISRYHIDVQYACDIKDRPDRKAFRRWAEAALQAQRERAELTVRVVDDSESAVLNQTYRGKSGPTNVLSFPAELPDVVDLPLLGDIVICLPVVHREAAEQGKAVESHFAHLTVHGVLHLLGYDHQETAEAEVMEGLEASILARLGYPNPY